MAMNIVGKAGLTLADAISTEIDGAAELWLDQLKSAFPPPVFERWHVFCHRVENLCTHGLRRLQRYLADVSSLM